MVVCLALWGVLYLFMPSLAWSQVASEAPVHIDRAVIAFDEKKYEEALKELQEALRADPQNVEALYYQGVIYLTLNQTAEAQGALEKARALRPANNDIAFQLGVLYFNRQDYERAEQLLRQVYRGEPTRPNLGYYLGFIEYRKKNYREAISLFQAAHPTDDNFAQLSRFYSGLAMSAMGFARQGQEEISEALRLQPSSPLTTPARRFGEVLQTTAARERFFRGELKLGIYYDTNVPVVPTAGSDLVSQAILEDQKRRKSEGELASANFSYTWLKALDWEGSASYRFLQTYNNHLTEFNTQDHTPSVALSYRSSIGKMPLIAGSQLAYDFIRLGNESFSQRWIFNPYLTLVESQSPDLANLTTLQFGLQAKDFFDDHKVTRRELRDAVNYMVGPVHFVTFADGRHYLKMGYQYDYDKAEGEDWTYSGHRLIAGGQYTLPWSEVRLRYDVDVHWRNHRYKHSLIPATATNTIKRRDTEPIHLFSVAKDFWTDYTATLDYLFDNNRSNLDPFTYKRHVVTTSLTWRF